MPAIVGAIKIISIGSSSIFHVGDVYMIQPFSEAKTFAGGGSFNTGDGISIRLSESTTQVNDQDKFDQIVTSL